MLEVIHKLLGFTVCFWRLPYYNKKGSYGPCGFSFKKKVERRGELVFWDAKKMQLTVLKSKILRAKVTEAQLDYQGSLGIDSAWMAEVGLLPYEKILVGNLNNGERFETYAIPCDAGGGSIELNGAAARLGVPGDLLVIMSFAQVDATEAEGWSPKVLVMKE